MDDDGALRVADHREPVAAPCGVGAGAVVQEAAGHGDASVDLALEVAPVGVLGELGADAEASQRPELGGGVSCVAELLNALQVLVVGVEASDGARAQGGDEHGAAAAKAHPHRLARQAAVALAVVGDAQGVGERRWRGEFAYWGVLVHQRDELLRVAGVGCVPLAHQRPCGIVARLLAVDALVVLVVPVPAVDEVLDGSGEVGEVEERVGDRDPLAVHELTGFAAGAGALEAEGVVAAAWHVLAKTALERPLRCNELRKGGAGGSRSGEDAVPAVLHRDAWLVAGGGAEQQRELVELVAG